MVIVAELVKPLIVVQVIVGSSPTLHTNADVPMEAYIFYTRSGCWDSIKRGFESRRLYKEIKSPDDENG